MSTKYRRALIDSAGRTLTLTHSVEEEKGFESRNETSGSASN